MAEDIARASISIDSNVQKTVNDLKQLNNQMNNIKKTGIIKFDMQSFSPIIDQLKGLSGLSLGISNNFGQLKNTLNDIVKIKSSGGVSNLSNILTNFAASGWEAKQLKGTKVPQRRAIDKALSNRISEYQNNINNIEKDLTKRANSFDKVNNRISSNKERDELMTALTGTKPKYLGISDSIANSMKAQRIELNDLKQIEQELMNLSKIGGAGEGGAIGKSLFGSIATGGVITVGIAAITTRLAVLRGEIEVFKKIAETGINYNISKENNIAALETLTQDPVKTQKIYYEAENYAKEKSISVDGMMQAMTQLSTYGIKPDDLMPMTRILANTSRGDSDKLKRQARALGQIIGKGKLQTEEKNQFDDAELPIMQLLEPITKKKGKELYDMMGKGQITPDMVIAAIKKSTEEGGRFFGAMDKKAATFSGKLENMSDTFDIFSGKMTEPVFDVLKTELDNILKMFDVLDNPEIMADLQKTVKEEIVPALEETKKVIMNILELDENNSVSENLKKIVMDIADVIDALNTVGTVGKVIVDLFLIIYDVLKITGNGLQMIGNVGYAAFAGLADALEKIVNLAMAAGNGIAYLYHKATAIFTGPDSEEGKAATKAMEDAKFWLKEAISGKTWGNEQTSKFFKNMVTDSEDVIDAMEGIKNRIKDIGKIASGTKYNPNFTDNKVKKEKEKKDEISSYNTNNTNNGKDTINKLADAFDNLSKSIDESIKKLGGFDTAFSKLSYEKFSPTKLKNRLIKQHKAINNWKENLASLKDRLDPEQYAQLIEMEQSGYGITSGLAKMSDAELADTKGMLGDMKKIGLDTTLQKMQIEHFGEIKVVGVNNEGQLIAIMDLLAQQTVKEKRSQSLSPSVLNGL